MHNLVQSVASKVALNLVKERKEKDMIDATAARKAHAANMKGTMKWLSFQFSFILQKMCELIKIGVHTDKALFKHCGAEVTYTQVYNHLGKWRTRWIHISKLRDLSGAHWDENSCAIMLEADHYQGMSWLAPLLHCSAL
jgi:hypothetical protein